MDLDFRPGDGLTISTTAGSPAIEPFKSAVKGAYFHYAWPKKNRNDRAFAVETDMVMKIPYEPLEASTYGDRNVIIKW